LVIIVFLILLLLNFRYSVVFFVSSLLFIIFVYYIQKSQMQRNSGQQSSIENYAPTIPQPSNIPVCPKNNCKNASLPSRGPPSGLAPSSRSSRVVPSYSSLSKQIPENQFPRKQPRGVTPESVGLGVQPESCRFCDYTWIEPRYNSPDYMSANQKLLGPANPNFSTPPVVTPPSHDLDYWRNNNLVTHSAVNEETQVDVYQSGYQVSTCCGNVDGKYLVPESDPFAYNVPLTEGYCNSADGGCKQKGCEYQLDKEINPRRMPTPRIETYLPPRREGVQSHENYPPASYTIHAPHIYPPAEQELVAKVDKADIYPRHDSGYNYPYLKTAPVPEEVMVAPNQPGQVNTACGYNPQQLFTSGLPTNFPSGSCQRDPVYKQYNENMFTQIIQPGVYSKNEVNQPINSNIGISFQQQFEPTTCTSNPITGEVMYTEHDPRLLEDAIVEPNLGVIEAVNMSNVYDPRHSGYGTSYRAYNDDLLGQTKFYYDDIDAVRMPNYITRSNIDFTPFADSYGPAPENGAYGNPNNADIHALANDAFTRATIEQRTGLQEQLLRKRRAEGWQQRYAPIRTGGQSGLGSMSCR